MQQGGVIAYPTEFCFGLGCDPENEEAIHRLLAIKQRSPEQGLIVIAADLEQVELVANLSGSPMFQEIQNSWPGPTTWVLPSRAAVSKFVTGRHNTLAIRVCGLPIARDLCDQFGSAIVSTSANRHGKAPLRSASAVSAELGEELDCILDAAVGEATTPSQIRDGQSGEYLR